MLNTRSPAENSKNKKAPGGKAGMRIKSAYRFTPEYIE